MKEIDQARAVTTGLRKIARTKKCGQDPVTGLCEMYGYAVSHFVSPACTKCKIRKACEKGKDLPMIPRAHNARVGDPEELESIPAHTTAENREKIDKNAPRYSVNDLASLLRELAGCGPVILDYIALKLDDYHISFSELAAKYKVSRQTVSKTIKRHAKKMPWLDEVFKQQQQNINRNPTGKNGKGGKK